MSPARANGHGVVLGAGMAGLTVAQALSEHMEAVTVVDRDRLHDSDDPRRGVPQGRHVHVLQLRGLDVLEGLFPGLGDELVAAGGPANDWGARGRFVMGGHRIARHPLGRDTISVSRPLLEQRVRRRVAANRKVTFAGDHDVLGLAATPERDRVTGVRVRPRGEDTSERTLPAGLVVDCTGRGSHARLAARARLRPPAH